MRPSMARRYPFATASTSWSCVAPPTDVPGERMVPLYHFGSELALRRTDNVLTIVVDAYSRHLGAPPGLEGAEPGEAEEVARDQTICEHKSFQPRPAMPAREWAISRYRLWVSPPCPRPARDEHREERGERRSAMTEDHAGKEAGPDAGGAECVTVEWPRQDVAVVTLNRPRQLNAIDQCVADRLPVVLRQLRDTFPRCRTVVLTGAGRGSCAGVDLSTIDHGGGGAARPVEGDPPATPRPDSRADYFAPTPRSSRDGWFLRTSPSDRLEGQERFAGMARAIRDLPQPVIAEVNGPAVGAGLALALASDVRLASPTAAFHVGAVKIGLSAGECGISYLLPRLISASRAFEVLLTGRPIEAEEAARIGLVSQVVGDGDLRASALEIADRIAANAPFAVSMSKQLMLANLDASSFEAALALENRTQMPAFATQDRQEAVRAFLEKRPPVFVGE